MLTGMHEYMTMTTSTQTMKTHEHQQNIQNDLFVPANDGWRLISTDTLIRGPFTDTITYWERSIDRSKA